MEAIVLKAVARELANELPARVQAVQQPSPRELVLLVRGVAERRLLISTDPEAPRLHLLEGRPAFLPSPTAFCRLLRKRLEGRVLVRVECPGVERSVTFAFAAPRGGTPDLLLIAELMGKHSNLILVEVATGLVIDSLQHVAPPMSRVRTVLPGLPFTPPPASGRVALDELDAPAFSALWRETGGNPEALFRGVLGLGSGMLALALGHARRAPGFAHDPGSAVYAALRACAAQVEGGATHPVFYPERGVLLPLPVPGWETEPQVPASSMSEAAAGFYAQRIRRRAGERRRGELSRELGRGLKRLAAEEARRREEAAADGEVAFLQAAAGELQAAAKTVPKGATAFLFADPRTGASAEVRLDPALGPRQNAEALFRRARKVRRRAVLAAQKLPALVARRKLLEEELALVADLPLETLLERPPAARVASGKPAATTVKTAKPGKAAQAPAGIREYRSPEGWRILVGKSGAGNDQLTGRIAAPDDFWFHVRDYPGAHVVLKGAGAQPPDEAIRAAGAVAAWHSGARAERLVDVAYTRRKNVRKVKGGPPGKVILGESETVRVCPGTPGTGEEPGA
ncbi:MAG: Rqc2 family fibronectin-binding protein [Candidatus Methylomirabilia bacterium]